MKTVYKETVTIEGVSETRLAKSPNKHNRFWIQSQMLGNDLTLAIEEGRFNWKPDVKERARVLMDEFGWEKREAQKIWCFGPENSGPNVLVDSTVWWPRLDEHTGPITTGFQWITSEGILTEENLRGVRFNLVDVILTCDAIHRGPGQIIPAIRRALFAAYLSGRPRLQEPVYTVEINTDEDNIEGVLKLLDQRRAEILSEEKGSSTYVKVVKAHLPVAEYSGFAEELYSLTGEQSYTDYVFDKWKTLDSDPYEEGSEAYDLLKDIRKSKGLKEDLPIASDFYDTL